MHLELGKTYLTREGEEVTIVYDDSDDPSNHYPFYGDNKRCYTASGNYFIMHDESPLNLVSEVGCQLKLPDGLPPVPEDGLEPMGWGWKAGPEEHDGYWHAGREYDEWMLLSSESRANGWPLLYYLRRAPSAISRNVPEQQPFDSLTEFIEHYGVVGSIWIKKENDANFAALVVAADDGGLVTAVSQAPQQTGGGQMSGGSTLTWDALVKYRWSEYPHAPWEECHTFTKS